MALDTPVDREFKVLPVGFVRDKVVLANFREGLRAQLNPETGQPMTEEDIARATAPGTRFYVEAQAIDDYAQLQQRNALYLADQIRLDRATGKWLKDFHAAPVGEDFLPATGGGGFVTVRGTPGTIVLGSSTLPDDSAYKARDPAGNVYQVLGSYTVGASGSVSAKMVATVTGAGTNPPAGTVLTWISRDPSMAATATVEPGFSGGFTGGTDRETEAELASRLAADRQFKPGGGNNAEMRAWARKSTNAVEEAFVYPCALNAGSVVVCITQKRAGAVGPLARIPSAETLATAIAYLTPLTSPVVPEEKFVIVTQPTQQPTDIVLDLALPRASASGFQDPQPFPSGPPAGFQAAYVSAFTSQTSWRIKCADATLPGQAALATLSGPQAPHFMLWDEAQGQWCEVIVTSIQDLGSGEYQVTCSGTIPAMTIALDQWVSPKTAFAPYIASAALGYFDELGPGEFFDPDTDDRGARCRRFPSISEDFPPSLTAILETRVTEALAGVAANIAYTEATEPLPQSAVQNGPSMLTLGRFAIYEI